jgi:NADH-quinone oxidoreductase subunit N
MFRGEFYALVLFSVVGMMIMVSGQNMLTLYMGLELLSLSLYALVALDRDNTRATEAAMKYFVLGALASGMLLYGMSMIYGMTGSLNIADINHALMGETENHAVLILGLVFIVSGLAFKLGAVPFQMWVPDVYEGSPTAVTLLISSVPKLAAFAFVIRLLVQALPTLAVDWQQMLMIMAVLSIVVGNITAIAQTNLKRMLAYSTISHIGFILYGLMSVSINGFVYAMFYVVSYVLMTLAGFGIILLLSRKGFEAENLEDLKGLNQRSPWVAFLMMIVMFSMAGVPPTLGFYAKFSVLQAALQAGYLWLVVFAVLMAVVGAFYYLRVIKLMYFDEPADLKPIDAPLDMRIILSVNALALLVIGLMPQSLMELCIYAVTRSLS